jgi:hypothetical protein
MQSIRDGARCGLAGPPLIGEWARAAGQTPFHRRRSFPHRLPILAGSRLCWVPVYQRGAAHARVMLLYFRVTFC